MIKTIINADDLGLSNSVNDAISDLMSKERITSASIMANGMAIDTALLVIKKFMNCSFGVHLNLTELRPLTETPEWKKYGLVNDNGEFNSLLRSIKPDKTIKMIIFKEFSAQIDLLLSIGVKISHIDSHHHIHTTPWIFFVLKAIQEKYKIYKVRCSLNIYPINNYFQLFQKFIWNRAVKLYIPTRTTDYFTPLIWFVENSHKVKKKNCTAELMVHPASGKKNKEMELLYSGWENHVNFPLKLISYNDL